MALRKYNELWKQYRPRIEAGCRSLLGFVRQRFVPFLRSAWSGLVRFDLIGKIITAADRIENAVRRVHGWFGLIMRIPGMRFTGGIAWRGLAAAGGIAVTGALISGLPAAGDEAQLASLIDLAHDDAPVGSLRKAPERITGNGDEWLKVTRPIAMFSLETLELGKQAPILEAKRSRDERKRQDIMRFGTFAETTPHLLLHLTADPDHSAAHRPFVAALAWDGAQHGLAVLRSSVPNAITTKFGTVETTDILLAQASQQRACLGFRLQGETALSIHGWWCGTGEYPADRQRLVCLLDRIDLMSSNDSNLRAMFARSELNRQEACSPPHLTAAGRRASLSEGDGKAPLLRMKALAPERNGRS